MEQTHPSSRERLFALDCLRGVASLAVVFWHWQHFAPQGNTKSTALPLISPGYSALYLLYNYGYLAVPLFFSMSRFIFFRFYAERISDHSISFRQFMGLRISRLYPLHFGTLTLVVVLQAIYVFKYGQRFVSNTDTYAQFVLNLLLLHGLGTEPESSYSFNVVTWSISVEIALYVIFYSVYRTLKPGWWCLAGIVLIGPALGILLPQLGQGVQCFFVGVLVSKAVMAPWCRGRVQVLMLVLAVFSAAMGAMVTWVVLEAGIKSALVIDFHPWWPRVFEGRRVPDRQIVERMFTWIIAPTSVLTVALMEPMVRKGAARFAFLGDISFAVYLLHFPLQIVAALLLGKESAAFSSPVFMIGFFSILIVCAYCGYTYFEMPLQRRLRERL